MHPYLAIQLSVVYFGLGAAAVLDTQTDGEYNLSLEDAIAEIRELQSELQELKISTKNQLGALYDGGFDAEPQEILQHRTRRDLSAQTQGCTPGTFGCPVYVTPHSVPSGSCILCPPGTSGPPGPVGPAGRDGRDAVAVVTSSVERPACAPQEGQGSSGHGGAVYIRWGHHQCPSSSELIYTGTGASSNHRTSGGGVDQLCLPANPVYDSPIAGAGSSRAFLYALEYQTYELAAQLWQDIPCAVCKAASRFSKLMVPGTNECPSSDWTREYGGYLMAERTHGGHHRSLHICVDREMQAATRSGGHASDNNMALMNFVEARCSSSGGGIPCGPYVDGYELTCAVCTQ